MRNHLTTVLLIFSLLSCETKTSETTIGTPRVVKNITEASISAMQWMNAPDIWSVVDSTLRITAGKETDFFNNPEDSSVVGTAPSLFSEMSGDFVVKTLVAPDFSSQWNAVSLMLHIDSLNWIKFAFENSDASGPTIVTVVTKGTSDDANGVILNSEETVWLALVRKDNIYSMHWSLDGEDYKMARLTAMPNVETVKIGIEAQSPVGDKAEHRIHYFDINETTVENLRNIN